MKKNGMHMSTAQRLLGVALLDPMELSPSKLSRKKQLGTAGGGIYFLVCHLLTLIQSCDPWQE